MHPRALCWLHMAALLLAWTQLAACAPSPLHEAAVTGDVAAVRRWIADGGPVDVQFDDRSFRLEGNYAAARGVRPLMLASQFGHLEVVRALVEAGADLYAESTCAGMDCRRNAFDYAIEHEQLAVARYLLERADRGRLVQRAEGQLVSLCLRHCDARSGEDPQTTSSCSWPGPPRATRWGGPSAASPPLPTGRPGWRSCAATA